ncbi:FAD-dependent oxidoreductase [Endothiovibrio diazotrophicus]
MNRRHLSRLLLLALIAAAVALFFALDVGHWLTLEQLQAQRGRLLELYHTRPAAFVAGYMALYIAVTALSLPGATVMTLAGAAVLGLGMGALAVSFASTIGATLAFLVARFLARDYVQERFRERLATINAGIEREGAFYLFTLRLIPIFPFFLINLAMGVTSIRTWRFFVVSQIGMLPGTLVYVNAGTQLGQLSSLSGVLSPGLIASFALLGLFPLAAKRIVDWLKGRRAYRGFTRPRRFDHNLVVIGGGAAGLVSAYIAAAVKAKVALIERERMGGDCLNTGCVPSKALIRTARFLAEARRAETLGLKRAEVKFDFAEVMERVQRVVGQVAPHDSVERYTGLGVEVIQGEAVIRSPWEVAVGERILTTRAIVVATGARPAVPPLPGLEGSGYLTSDTLWGLRERPARLAVLGGGPIGCELAQCFQRLGSQVTLIQRGPRLLPKEDPEFSAQLRERFEAEGMRVLTGHAARRIEGEEGNRAVVCAAGEETVRVPYDRLLIALGRRANVAGFGLEALGVTLAPGGTVANDPFLRTRLPNLYVCGDVAGPFQFTHTAAHQAWYAAVNALFSPWKRFRADYSVIPRVTYSDPEIARVGLNEEEARARGIPYEVTTFDLAELDRAIADGAADGLVKVLTVPGRDRILGATIAGPHAGELIGEFVTAMRHRLGLNKILATIHPYPTWSEANKYAAGNWRRAHAPERVLRVLEGYHRWRRGGEKVKGER